MNWDTKLDFGIGIYLLLGKFSPIKWILFILKGKVKPSVIKDYIKYTCLKHVP